MCLAVPCKVVNIEGKTAEINFGGGSMKVSIQLVPGVKTGDYVLVHAGYAIQIVDEAEARATMSVFQDVYGAANE